MTDRAGLRCPAFVTTMVMMVPATRQRLHDLGRHAVRAQFVQQAGTGRSRHVTEWGQGAYAQHRQRDQQQVLTEPHTHTPKRDTLSGG